MKVDLDQTEITEVLNALDMYLRSAKRAQNTGRNPEIREI